MTDTCDVTDPLAVTAGGNPTAQINVTDRRRSAGETGAVESGGCCGSAQLDITSRSHLGHVLPSDEAAG